MRDFHVVISDYLNAFSKDSIGEQQALLHSSVSNDVVFANPGVEGEGHSDLLAHIAAYQKKFPKSTFRVEWILEQHGQVLAQWTQLNPDGSECLTAHSYALLDSEGKIKRWAGFWKPGAVEPVYSAD